MNRHGIPPYFEAADSIFALSLPQFSGFRGFGGQAKAPLISWGQLTKHFLSRDVGFITILQIPLLRSHRINAHAGHLLRSPTVDHVGLLLLGLGLLLIRVRLARIALAAASRSGSVTSAGHPFTRAKDTV